MEIAIKKVTNFFKFCFLYIVSRDIAIKMNTGIEYICMK